MIPLRRFYFLRHGQTDWNREGRYQGVTDVPLNATGVLQAREAAAALAGVQIDMIVASPLIRALKTAAIVSETVGAPMHIDSGLRERNFGSFDGHVVREMKLKFGVPLDMEAPSILPSDADCWGEIFERVPPVIGHWLAANPQATFLFVAHGGVFDALHSFLVGPRIGAESKHASPYVVAPSPTGWTFTSLDSKS